MAVQLWIADGVTTAADELREIHAVDTDIEILETRCCALSQFGGEGVHIGDDDVTASVLLPFHGALSGATLLVMEPEDALRWCNASGGAVDPLVTFVELSERILTSVVVSASAALEYPTEIGRPSLEETSLAGCLLRTHAPSDTVLTSTRIRIQAGRQYYDANFYLLMDPKRMSAMLGALSISAH